MAGMMRVPRSRGVLSGLLLVLLGAWGALIPFIGPYFHYAYTPDHTWTYNTDRLYLEVLPGAAVLLGGLITLVASSRPTAVFATWLAALGGAWYVVGRTLSTLWTTGHVVAAGQPVGSAVTRAAEDIGFFTGLGVVILFFAAVALGRFTVIGAKEAALAEEALAEEGQAPDMPEREPTAVATGDSLPRRTASGSGSSYFDRAPDDTVADGSLPATQAPGRERTGRWGLFGKRSEETDPAEGTEPVPPEDRPVGRHSA
jgi:hypothetical protein